MHSTLKRVNSKEVEMSVMGPLVTGIVCACMIFMIDSIEINADLFGSLILVSEFAIALLILNYIGQCLDKDETWTICAEYASACTELALEFVVAMKEIFCLHEELRHQTENINSFNFHKLKAKQLPEDALEFRCGPESNRMIRLQRGREMFPSKFVCESIPEDDIC